MDPIILLIIGFVLLFLGGEVLVKGSAGLAVRFGLTPLVIGLTVVSMGTSCPELVVSLQAAMMDSEGISLGNVIGSNICNIGLILGLCVTFRPIFVHRKVLIFDVPVMFAISILLVLILEFAQVTRLVGVFFLCGLITYIYFIIKAARKEFKINEENGIEDELPELSKHILLDVFYIVAGLACLFYGSGFIVDGAVVLAKRFNVSDAIIGLSIVAVGTSLPELATTFVAVLRRRYDIAFGNIIGSNIFNILGILGVSGVVHPFKESHLGWVTLAVMLFLSLILYPFIKKEGVLSRKMGVFLLLVYIGYIYYLYLNPDLASSV